MHVTIHLITDFLSIAVGLHLYLQSKIYDTLGEHNRTNIIIGALVGALIGSRLIAALENPEIFFNPPSLLYFYANKTIIGGIAGGILGVEVVKKLLGIKHWTGNRTLIPLAVAIIVGRIGCFSAGVEDGTVGGPCSYAWCLEQGDGILRHPNSLYEILFVLFFLGTYFFIQKIALSRIKTFIDIPGVAFRIFIITYFSLRFGIEFLKETHPLLVGINCIQLVCLLFVLWYVRDVFRVWRSTRKIDTSLVV